MSNAIFSVPKPSNEPCYSYLPHSSQREKLKEELKKQLNEVVTIPLIIDGKEIYTDNVIDVTCPHDHKHVIARCCIAGEKELKMAVDAALTAKAQWEAFPWEQRAAIFLRCAELISNKYRYKLNAATMLGQSKTAYQAEIDSACEITDFLRFNVYYAQEIFKQQPNNSTANWNQLAYRPLEGFVVAITPFNFTAIGGNLGSAPALLGNTVIWKPSTTAVLSNYFYMKILMEAGLPKGVMNFVPSRGKDMSAHVLSHPQLAGCHFTGSTSVFRDIWRQVGSNIEKYASYPRLVGETGGKDFIFAHNSADIDALAGSMVRGAFEYQGQKCSAASRAFIPESIWEDVLKSIKEKMSDLTYGNVTDFRNFIGAVIDESSFDNISSYIEDAKKSPDAEIVIGGKCDKSVGYFVEPTIIKANSPYYKSMTQEIFGPVLSVYVYPDEKIEETLEACDKATPYALTGSVFANDRKAIIDMSKALRNAAGNIYINDKPTGATVGQQPFGGSRASGTNDKAGSKINLYRWLSIHSIKECLMPSGDVTYPFMDEE